MPDRATLYVMVGLPGSGKSTYAERLRTSETPKALILSSDDIRWTMNSMDDYRSAGERYVRGVIENFARGCLLHGRDVIVDATNLTERHRKDALLWAREYDSKAECHYIRCSVRESARRSAKWIPKNDIERLEASFVEPNVNEGFDKLFIIDGVNGWRVLRIVHPT